MSETLYNEKGKASVQALFGLLVGIKTVSVSPNPYKDDLIDVHELDNGSTEAWTDHATGLLVHVGPNVESVIRTFTDKCRVPIGDLRNKAISLIEKIRPGFDREMRARMTPFEDNWKRQIYFFRWDSFSEPCPENEMPPFIQLGLWADGTLASYANTLKT